jgi:hypothetical protein
MTWTLGIPMVSVRRDQLEEKRVRDVGECNNQHVTRSVIRIATHEGRLL